MFAYLQQVKHEVSKHNRITRTTGKKEVHGKQDIKESIQAQSILLAKTFGCVRFIYNRMLSDKIKHYEETKQMLNNTPAQYKLEFEWLKEVACSFKRSIEPAESL